ncbi:MAG TPA: tRNA pseudouridine(38-40) synthase TruA [Propionibacteriaceae bacterium]|nr:tRNA pseudouridine(38-40) synthase TruA [Propionibacteriaceae bacterium]
MQRWRLDLAYDGTGFSGWAAQPGQRTVQGELERWIPQVLRLGHPVALVVAGRTDAGVHARGQVAHLDVPLQTRAALSRLPARLARVLPADLVVTSATEAPAGFDARFSALWRRYVYRLSDSDIPPDPLLRSHVARSRGRLDVAAMNTAGASLLGLRDFAAFCRRREGATTIRTLLELTARRADTGPLAGVVEVTVRADAFCHSMVRSLVGALVAVGAARRDPDWLAATAAAGVRSPDVEVMPALGLTLEEVRYPPAAELAARAQQARSTRRIERA